MRGFVKLKKSKNPRVGGWVTPRLGFLSFLNIVFFVHVSKKKIDRWVGGWGLDNSSFLEFFQPLSVNYLIMLIVEKDVHVAAHLKDYHVLLHASVLVNNFVRMYINKLARNIEPLIQIHLTMSKY